jgi:hypothetical protein
MQVSGCWEADSFFVASKVASGEWGARSVATSKRALAWLDTNR